MYQTNNRDIKLKSNTLFNYSFVNVSKHTLINQYIERYINSDSGTYQQPLTIFTPNPEQIMLAEQRSDFAAALRQADILIPDGVGIVLASQLLALRQKAQPLTARLTGIDVTRGLLEKFPNAKVVVIGGRRSDGGDVSEAQTIHLTGSLEGRTVRVLAGYQNIKAPTKKEADAVEAFLKKEQPDVVLVALGAPFQEMWTLQQLPFLAEHQVKVVMVVGGAIDVLSGKLHRAPHLWQALGLEWLFRLFQEPWRWRRQLKLISFIRLTLRELFS